MMDLTSLAATMGASLASEAFTPTGGDAAVAGTGKSTATSAGQGTPSTEGFLQVLEMFLGSSPLPSSLLGATAITQSGNADPNQVLSSADADQTDIQDLADAGTTDLDEQTCEAIASLLQMLGFQVKAAEIQQLSPLDREQLDNALEFVQRNLERGSDSAQVAENAALLLPRPWALDDADGSPVGTGEASTATDGKRDLPTDLVADIASLREKIQASLGKVSEESGGKQGSDSSSVAASALAAASSGSSTTSDGETTSDFEQNLSKQRERDAARKSASEATGTFVIDPNSRESAAGTAETTQIPKHLPPGGTTSELIGRQVLEKVHLQLTDGKREIKLRLWPEELGEVRLALKMNDNDKVHANMVVENDAVRQAILDATPQLKDALARHGLDLERLSVSVSQKDAQQTDDDGQGRRNGDARRSGSGGGWSEAEIEIPETVALGEDTGLRNGHNTIDLWS
jgi:flagellar hook-length control protein FliK